MEFELTQTQRELFDGTLHWARNLSTASGGGTAGGTRERWENSDQPTASGLPWTKDVAAALDLVIAMQALGYGSTDAQWVLALTAHLFGGEAPISKWGTAEQQAAFLPKLMSGAWYASRCLSAEVTAERVNGAFRLNGRTGIASAGRKPDVALVFARMSGDPESPSCTFLVSLAGTDAVIWERSRGHTLGCADALRLDKVSVPGDRMLGAEADADALLAHLVPREHLAVQATRLGLLQRLLERALDAARAHALRLKLKGVPPHAYQMLGHKLADFSVRFDAAELMLRRAAWLMDGRDAAAEVALAGLAIESGVIPTAFEVVRLQREYGFDEERAWSGLLADAVEYGRFLCGVAQMRSTVGAAIRMGST